MWHVWETGEVHTGFWWGDLGEKDHLQDLGVDGRTAVNCILKEYVRRAWIRLIWLRIGTSDRLL